MRNFKSAERNFKCAHKAREDNKKHNKSQVSRTRRGGGDEGGNGGGVGWVGVEKDQRGAEVGGSGDQVLGQR